jgi:hypothetical protein
MTMQLTESHATVGATRVRLPSLLGVLGVGDIASGAFALADAAWLGRQLDLGTTAVRLIGAFLLVLGAEKILLRERRTMARVSIAVEALFGLAALDVALMGDPTTLGIAVLIGTAVACEAVALTLFALSRR